MKTIAGSALVPGAAVCMSVSAAGETPLDDYGWAVDCETAGAAGRHARWA